ncbi:unknown [Crocosphaera subtropica ATCC 51142]|uniref:Glycosyltransferase RgtA/B/C/D-like domain-containing protein n=1 Tax=Crocosphaera subtropica (strain ATCC 51142 / BH68) TaxID=43989 RepID=B1WVH1_CROS5|nr:glycosyltransferase family 39 protein [Crocosphaera subtropica]ACB53961.1 unknown [Crocosphaera subtropica ATCC 51142]
MSKFWSRFVIITLIVIGIFCRIINLDTKAYWYDETFTSFQLSGYSSEEVTNQILDGREIGIEELQQYQNPQKDSQKTVVDTVKRIAIVEPQLTPLYFILLRFWTQWLGDSIAVIRSLSVMFSLFTLPLMYWLAKQLFQSSIIAWMSVVLLAISPIHVLYAQEARPYSLYTLATLLSSVLFLQAIKLKNYQSWFLYAISVTFGLYSFFLTCLVYFSHGIYIILTEGLRLSQNLRRFVASMIFGIVTFIPWIYLIVQGKEGIEKRFTSEQISIVRYLIKWIRNLTLFFVDFDLDPSSPKVYLIPFSFLLLLIIGLIFYSLYFLYVNGDKISRTFIFSSFFVPLISLLIIDLLLGTNRITVTRYLIPYFIGVHLAVAYLLVRKNFQISLQTGKQIFWRFILVFVVSLGVISSTMIANAQVWWNKDPQNVNHELAMIINQSSQPLIVSDFWFVNVISLSHLLDPKVKFQLVVEPDIPSIKEGYSDIFLYQPSENLKTQLSEDYQLEAVRKPLLWKLPSD